MTAAHAEVKFTRWTKAGEIRYPVYFGPSNGTGDGRCVRSGLFSFYPFFYPSLFSFQNAEPSVAFEGSQLDIPVVFHILFPQLRFQLLFRTISLRKF